ELLVVTTAKERNDGFDRFVSYARRFKYNLKVLGLDDQWSSDLDVEVKLEDGLRVELYKNVLERHKYSGNLVVLFVKNSDTVITQSSDKLLEQFVKMKADVVFSSDKSCLPSSDLAEYYPTVKVNEKRYLSSASFIGYASSLYSMMSSLVYNAKGVDDQTYFTNVFLNDREKYNIVLDSRSSIFQNLNDDQDDVSINFDSSYTYLYNDLTGTSPIIIHGNGPIRAGLNSLTNYVPDQWTISRGCLHCLVDTRSLDGIEVPAYPQIYMAIFIEKPMYFVEDFFLRVSKLTYPKERIDLYIHYLDVMHAKNAEKFVAEHGNNFKSVQVQSDSEVATYKAKIYAFEQCMKMNCEYFFSLDAEAHIEKLDLIEMLIERNRSLVAPMLVRPGKMWANFMGTSTTDGHFKKSDDFTTLVLRERKGLWNVPYLTSAFLLQARHLPSISRIEFKEGDNIDAVFCLEMRKRFIFMYVDNFEYYGHLVNSDDFDATANHLNSDLYAIFSNAYTWEKKYVHPDYFPLLNQTVEDYQSPCPDVFWFPIVTEKFCDELVGEMEHFGDWSSGKNEDNRLETGYENVPTVDIHTNQIGWEDHWLQFLKNYIVPLNQRAFEGYFSEGRALMNFVVRYRPDEQDRLRPHADSSTFTVNIALNTPGVDYQGGGVRMLRYECSVTELKKGWMLMHPGKLTHHHEGLPVTAGTRYIMVSFVDPTP
ncbi:hypothetical protein HELRODRAFT_81988, partial [Helobdella robusta]|uniref:Fe2OG dioxygenase domain-containing protein n=1 Tax=Helobdella robusta TaxID=6412 RepID=T1G4L3_HELRO